MGGTLETVCDRDVARGQIDQASRNEERRHPARSPLLQHYGRFRDAGETADPRAYQHAGLRLLLISCRLPPRIVERLPRGAHRKYDEVVNLALLLRLHPLVCVEGVVRAVAARNLASNLGGKVGDIEALDAPGAAFSVEQAAPSRLNSACERCHHAEACDDHAPHLRLIDRCPDMTVACCREAT